MNAQDRPGVISNVQILLEDRSSLLDDPGCLPEDLEEPVLAPLELVPNLGDPATRFRLAQYRAGLEAGRERKPIGISFHGYWKAGWEAGRCGCNCLNPYPDGWEWPETSAENNDCPYHSADRRQFDD